MFIQSQVKPSTIFGQGIFTRQPVRKGAILCLFFLPDGQVITEEQFVAEVAKGTHMVMRTGTRHAGIYFTWSNTPADTMFFNHSFEPNVLCHCGTCFALRDIAPGEELTVDYRYLLDTTDVGLYHDARTGREIRGLPPRQTLLETTRQLLALLESLPDWDGMP